VSDHLVIRAVGHALSDGNELSLFAFLLKHEASRNQSEQTECQSYRLAALSKPFDESEPPWSSVFIAAEGNTPNTAKLRHLSAHG
jgi:hypothetical protein